MPRDAAGDLQVEYVVWLSLIDAVLLVGLILLFLRAHGERPRDVLFGSRPIAGELAYGIPLTAVALAGGIGVLLAIRYLLPWLHTVEQNPLEGLLGSPRDAWLFALVVLVAGGIREEIQRAFLLHRFEVWLGGGAGGRDRDQRRVRRRASPAGLRRRDRDGAARRVLGRDLPAAALGGGPDGQPRGLQPAADSAVRRHADFGL